MTNVRRLIELYDMQLHTAEEISNLFDSYLFYGYSGKVVKRMNKNGKKVSQGTIRKVRAGLMKNQTVLNYLIREAIAEKARQNRAKKETYSLIQNV